MTSIAPAPVYEGRLSELFPLLERELPSLPPAEWAQRTLRSGASVAIIMLGDGRRLLRISRPEAPRSVHARQGWEGELRIIQKHLGAERWTLLPEVVSPVTGVAAVFMEPRA